MNKDEIESVLNVATISTDPAITEVLLYANWTVGDGLQYLVGIFDEHIDENNVGHLVTLGNVHYSERDNKEIYDAFFAKYDRLKRIPDGDERWITLQHRTSANCSQSVV